LLKYLGSLLREEMTNQIDLSILDRPEILEVIFPVVYYPFYLSNNIQLSSTDVTVYSIEVEKGIKTSCRFWVSDKENPSILDFHGNGEVVANHDWIAPLYNQRGVNFFVDDYRGYGSSNGKPTIPIMIGDAHTIFKGFKEIISKEGFKKGLFLMGRSLGSTPAIELAFNFQDGIVGLIIESGTANNFRRLGSYLGITAEEDLLGEESLYLNKVKIRQIHKLTLIIHGKYD